MNSQHLTSVKEAVDARMRRTSTIGPLLATLAFLGAASSPVAAEDCTLKRVASLDAGVDPKGGIYVPMTLNKVPVNMLIETGSSYSTLSDGAADRLQLRRRPAPVKFLTFGGASITSYVETQSASLGDMQGGSMSFLVMPSSNLPVGVDGTLGLELLSNYDLELDPAGGKVNLFSHDHCEGKVVYWATTALVAIVPFQFSSNGQMEISVDIDGKPFLASVSTGYSRSLLSYDAAASAFGWNGSTPNLESIGAKDSGFYQYPFGTISFKGIEIRHPDIILVTNARRGWSYGPALGLSMSVLRQLHIYIAFKERNLYLTAAEAH